MAATKIAVINKSTVEMETDEVQKVVAALQQQVSRDFYPAWGLSADLRYAADGNPQPGEWWLVILDDADQAGALGYHDVTSEGLPLGKVFAKTTRQYNEKWSVTASHELLEMLADPAINLTVFMEQQIGGRLYAYEVCDACEADQFAYTINGVEVSDFVLPSWFESFRNQGPFDHQNRIHKPLTLLEGGYIGIYDVASGGGWTQLTAEMINARARAPVGSRRERRNIPISKRIFSTAHVLSAQVALEPVH
jgi:hypothetical protein